MRYQKDEWISYHNSTGPPGLHPSRRLQQWLAHRASLVDFVDLELADTPLIHHLCVHLAVFTVTVKLGTPDNFRAEETAGSDGGGTRQGWNWLFIQPPIRSPASEPIRDSTR